MELEELVELYGDYIIKDTPRILDRLSRIPENDSDVNDDTVE